MKRDKLIIKDEHRRAALGIMDLLWPELEAHRGKYILTIAPGIESRIIQQDDYFIYPPQTNLRMRRRTSVGWGYPRFVSTSDREAPGNVR